MKKNKPSKDNFSFQFETFGQLEDALELIFSSSAASVILYTAAIKCGVHLHKRVKKEFSTKEEALNLFSQLKREETGETLFFAKLTLDAGQEKL